MFWLTTTGGNAHKLKDLKGRLAAIHRLPRPSRRRARRTIRIGRSARMASDSRGAAVALDVGIAAAPSTKREFDFSDADFKFLSQLAYEQSGIVLSDSKRNLVYGRLSRRLRVLGIEFVPRIPRLSRRPTTRERSRTSSTRSRPTTPSSSAKSHHFDHFRSNVVEPVQRQRPQAAAGCGSGRPAARSGEEPYTIAVVLAREMRRPRRATTFACSRPISTPTSSPRRRAANIAANAHGRDPGRVSGLFPRRSRGAQDAAASP